MSLKARPDIRAITRLVPRSGNLVQGQSELAIDPDLARAASDVISASQNHYSPAEGVRELRNAVAQKILRFNGIEVDPQATPLELLITPGATGGLALRSQLSPPLPPSSRTLLPAANEFLMSRRTPSFPSPW